MIMDWNELFPVFEVWCKPFIWNSLSSVWNSVWSSVLSSVWSSMLNSMSFLSSMLWSTVPKAFFKANSLCSNKNNVIYFLIVIFHHLSHWGLHTGDLSVIVGPSTLLCDRHDNNYTYKRYHHLPFSSIKINHSNRN